MAHISVIMPVYNDSKHLRGALKSLLAQTFADIEIIVVNDGSVDDSEAIIDEFASKDKRIIKISQKNQGVAAARNNGLQVAGGKYIAFADSDDKVPRTAYESMYRIAEQNDADLVIGGFKKDTGLTSRKNPRMVKISRKPKVEVDDKDIIHTFALWNKLFKREIIKKNNIKFENFKHVEDAVFLYSFLQYASEIFTCPDIVYTYYKRIPSLGTSTTQILRPGLFEDAINACNRVLELADQWPEDYKEELRYKILRSTIIGDYYRRLWVLDKNTEGQLIKQIYSWRDSITEADWNRIVNGNKDLQLSDKVMDSDEISESPIISIIVDSALNREALNSLLNSLYNQNTPGFEVVLDASVEKMISSDFKYKANLKFISMTDEHEAYFFTALGKITAPYVMFIDKPIVFDHDSLRLMIKAIDKNNVDFVSARMVAFKDSIRKLLWPMEISFEKDYLSQEGDPEGRNSLDWTLCNKMFRTCSLKNNSELFNDNSTIITRYSFENMSYKKLRTPVIAFLEDEDVLLQNINPDNHELRKECVHYRRKKKKEKIASYLRRIVKCILKK